MLVPYAISSSHLYEFRSLSVGGLEGPSVVLAALSKRNTKLEQLDENAREVLEEQVVVGSVLLNPRLESLVLDQGNIGGKHHEGLGGLVLELLGAVPLLLGPLLIKKEAVEVVGHNGRGEGPRTLVARSGGVASADGVATAEGDNLSVVEAHAVEDVTQVLGALAGVGQTAIGGAGSSVGIATARSVRDVGSQHLLDGADTAKDPEIGVGDPGVLGCSKLLALGMGPTWNPAKRLTLDRLEEVTSSNQTGVGTVSALGSKSHGGTVAATGLGLLVIGAAAVPCETHQHGAIAAIVIVLDLQAAGNVVVDLLVVGLGGNEAAGRGRGTRGEEPDTQTSGGGSETEVDNRVGLLLGLRRVEAAALLAESLSRSSSEGAGSGAGCHAGKLTGRGGHLEDDTSKEVSDVVNGRASEGSIWAWGSSRVKSPRA